MPGEVDQSGMTELHIACEIGRSDNVEVLLNYAFKGIALHTCKNAMIKDNVVSNKVIIINKNALQ